MHSALCVEINATLSTCLNTCRSVAYQNVQVTAESQAWPAFQSNSVFSTRRRQTDNNMAEPAVHRRLQRRRGVVVHTPAPLASVTTTARSFMNDDNTS